ncbi:hypothetical protein ACFVJ8_28530 [Streptomyces yangpuensis]|uniref:hypothetical protein n=1 Tax=Streptomyces yangpuensis TaxID=1648182 RepID=UPI0036279833
MGDIVHTFPGHVTRYWGMPNIRWIPLPDRGTLRFALVWRTEAGNDLVRAPAATVRDLGVLRF